MYIKIHGAYLDENHCNSQGLMCIPKIGVFRLACHQALDHNCAILTFQKCCHGTVYVKTTCHVKLIGDRKEDKVR